MIILFILFLFSSLTIGPPFLPAVSQRLLEPLILVPRRTWGREFRFRWCRMTVNSPLLRIIVQDRRLVRVRPILFMLILTVRVLLRFRVVYCSLLVSCCRRLFVLKRRSLKYPGLVTFRLKVIPWRWCRNKFGSRSKPRIRLFTFSPCVEFLISFTPSPWRAGRTQTIRLSRVGLISWRTLLFLVFVKL